MQHPTSNLLMSFGERWHIFPQLMDAPFRGSTTSSPGLHSAGLTHFRTKESSGQDGTPCFLVLVPWISLLSVPLKWLPIKLISGICHTVSLKLFPSAYGFYLFFIESPDLNLYSSFIMLSFWPYYCWKSTKLIHHCPSPPISINIILLSRFLTYTQEIVNKNGLNLYMELLYPHMGHFQE